MLKKRWSCYLLFWVKTVEVLTWLDGWKKILVNFWYARDTHWLIKSLLLVGVNTVVLSDWVVGETREILNDHARGWRWWNYARRSPDLGRACGSNLKGRLICPLHVVSRISFADAPADGYSSIKIAMIKQNVWWTMFPARFLFPSPQASTRPQRGLCGGERSLTFAATFPQNASCNTGTQVRVTVKSNKRQSISSLSFSSHHMTDDLPSWFRL